MPSLEALIRDLRLAFRGLRRDKGFTATALLTFALCLGANVALFAVVNAVLVRPLPYPNPGQIVTIFNQYPKAGVDRAGASVPHYLERRSGIAAFAEAAAFRGSGATIGEAGSPTRIASMNVTPSFFRVLGVEPALGRGFREEEGVYGKNDVVILSDGLWRQEFGADPAAIGRKLRVDGSPQTVVGVMAPGFTFGASKAELLAPLCFGDDERKPDQRHSNNMSMIARLRPGATIGAAQSQVDALNKHALEQDPYAKLVVDAGFHTAVADLHTDLVAETRPMLVLLQAGVLFLLLIGAVNLANLLLVRSSARTKEFSVRRVLGAGRLQLARQLVAETLVLSLAGGLLGLGLGWAGLRGLESLGADDLPHFAPYRLDGTVCLVALAASVVTGLLLAVPALWHALRENLAQALSVESRGGTTTRAAHRLRHALIVAQFALAFTLLAGAGLLGISFSRVLSVNPGFRPDNVLTGGVSLPWLRYKDDKPRFEFIRRLGQELRPLPGMSAVGFTTNLPFSGNVNDNAVSIEGQPPLPGDSLHTHFTSGVAGDFFAAMGIPLREGRLLTDDDSVRSLRVCVVDEDVVRRYWPGRSALGQRLFNGAPGQARGRLRRCRRCRLGQADGPRRRAGEGLDLFPVHPLRRSGGDRGDPHGAGAGEGRPGPAGSGAARRSRAPRRGPEDDDGAARREPSRPPLTPHASGHLRRRGPRAGRGRDIRRPGLRRRPAPQGNRRSDGPRRPPAADRRAVSVAWRRARRLGLGPGGDRRLAHGPRHGRAPLRRRPRPSRRSSPAPRRSWWPSRWLHACCPRLRAARVPPMEALRSD